MPKRTDIHTILLIGSGPIIIGQACEFDYSGTQAVKTLKSLGYRVVLINSNPATIMTDPDFADRTYIEPITEEIIANIITKEKVDAILPTMGGQTALNVAMSMFEKGMLKDIKFLGANPQAIKKGEDRQAFKEAMLKIGMDLPKSRYAYTEEEAIEAAKGMGFSLENRFLVGKNMKWKLYAIKMITALLCVALRILTLWAFIQEILLQLLQLSRSQIKNTNECVMQVLKFCEKLA